jgi:hypothetical protein
MSVHVPANLADSLRGAIRDALRQRLASKARTKAIFLGVGRMLVEPDVLAERLTRGTGRFAVDAGREDTEKKSSVLTGVALLYDSPAFIVVQHGDPPNGIQCACLCQNIIFRSDVFSS